MKSNYLIAKLPGGMDANFAVLELTDATRKAINAAHVAMSVFAETHGGDPSLRHNGPHNIVFLRSIPEELGPHFTDDIADKGPVFLNDLAGFHPDRFFNEAEAQLLVVDSEMTGILVRPDCLRITGYERHTDELLVSDSIDFILNNDRLTISA